ncbi:MAG: TonB-dependent receptor [Erythrobacter sp.]|jgi:outer membrane receptor protein involved in Fe transport|nr:TonB-dependent receptor [Erythrobacter sp.]
MRKTTQLRSSAGLLAVGLALAATPAFAQDAETEDMPEVTETQTIVVTGSRIDNPNLTATSPVASVSEDFIQLRQATVVDDFLREIPGITPSIGAQVNNGNGGSTFVDLRGIGSNRNLVLLNGTRVVPAGLAGVTNIDVIPVALLERVDVLTGGAGAAYGADAISGVVNFITKDDFAGFDVSATNQITEEGDGNIFRVDATIGANFDDGRGNAVFSLGYTNRDEVFQGARPFGANNISSNTGNPGGSSTTVPSVITVPGTTSGTLQVAPDGQSLIPFYEPFNFNPFNIYQLPLEQYRLYGAARYEVTDAIEVFSEGMFVQSTNTTIIAPSGTFRNVLQTPLSSPFIPTGIRNQICGFDTSGTTPGVQPRFTQAECDAAALATDPNDPNYRQVGIDYGRRFVEFGTRDNDRVTTLWQAKAGFRGGITETLDWELFGAYGESTVASRQSGNGLRSRLQQSVLATSTNACLDPSNGCVPIDLFGPVGSLTPEVQAFLDVGNSTQTNTSLGQVQGFITGDFGFTVPSAVNPVSMVLGGEYRRYTAGVRSDILTQTPGEVLGNGAASPDVFGAYEVSEAFGELVIPLIEDGFVREARLDLGARVSDYSTTGTEFTWKVGGTISPVDALTFRGNFQRVTRAPNINELFAPQVTGLDNFDSDPCVGAAPVNNADLRAVCLAQGAPANAIGNIIVDPAGQVNVTSGGNPNLAAETADTWTVGLVFQPDFVPGLSLTVDYYNITLSDAITTPTADDVFIACFGPDFRTNPSVNAGSTTDPACTGIRRNPATGNLFGAVDTTPGLPQVVSNLGRIETDGIDVNINYSTDIGFGMLNLNFLGNWTNSNTFDSNQFDPNNVVFECAGFFGTNCGSIIPEFSFTQRTTLALDDVDISLLWRFIDEVELERSVFNDQGQAPFLDEFETINAEHYFDLTLRWQATENFAFTVAVINLFDNDPQIVGSNIGTTAFNSGNIFPSTYDPLGRRYSITGQITF